MRLKLPILFNTEKTSSLRDAGIDTDLNDCILNEVIFYKIDAVSVYMENGKKTRYCSIWVGENEFICNFPIQEVDKLITKEMLIYSL